jgi:hypothetical protein
MPCKAHSVFMPDGSECPACIIDREDPAGNQRRRGESMRLWYEAYGRFMDPEVKKKYGINV